MEGVTNAHLLVLLDHGRGVAPVLGPHGLALFVPPPHAQLGLSRHAKPREVSLRADACCVVSPADGRQRRCQVRAKTCGSVEPLGVGQKLVTMWKGFRSPTATDAFLPIHASKE